MFFRFFHLLAIYLKKNRKIIDALQIRKKISLNYLKSFYFSNRRENESRF